MLCPSLFQPSQILHLLHSYVIKVELLQMCEALWSPTQSNFRYLLCSTLPYTDARFHY